MKITPFVGIDKLIFGMKKTNVIEIYGLPSRQHTDEDGNLIYIYHNPKFALSFYADADFRLGYIVAANSDLVLYNHNVIGKATDLIPTFIPNSKPNDWILEAYDTVETHQNMDYWLTFQTEFGEVVKVELGANISDEDEYDFRF